MKIIASVVVFLFLGFVLIFGTEKLYQRQNETALNTDATKTASSTNNAKPLFAAVKQILNLPQNIIEKTPPHFLPGFDWSLAKGVEASDYSGLIVEEKKRLKIAKNSFIIVRWDESNPLPGKFDFTAFEKDLKRYSPDKVLVRLEVNSACEAPQWALKKLRQTSKKSLVFWDQNYIKTTSPFIREFAKRYASSPRIIGVQLGLADGEFRGPCADYDNKQGWGEFWMSPSERNEAETLFGFDPEIFASSTLENMDVYIEAFGQYKHKLAFTNFGHLFTYDDSNTEGAKAYNKKLKIIAQYALDQGLGNRDGAIERWMSYTDKIYGNVFKNMPDGSCKIGFDEAFARQIKGRYWGTENEFYGKSDYVLATNGPFENQAHRFLISSLRALQMRRNFMSVSESISDITPSYYETAAFINYLYKVLGKQIDDTPDAFVLLGERYIAASRLEDQNDVACVKNNGNKVPIRSFGRWLEEDNNNQTQNKAAIKIRMPKEENYWEQNYYMPYGIDYEYFARESRRFSFNLNDELASKRCRSGCEVEIKATFKDTAKTRLTAYVAEGKSHVFQTLGDNQIKTVTFKLLSEFKNDLAGSDIVLESLDSSIPLILLRVSFL